MIHGRLNNNRVLVRDLGPSLRQDYSWVMVHVQSPLHSLLFNLVSVAWQLLRKQLVRSVWSCFHISFGWTWRLRELHQRAQVPDPQE